MVEQDVFAEAKVVADSARDEAFSLGDGLPKGLPVREPGGDGGRIGAARAVRIDTGKESCAISADANISKTRVCFWGTWGLAEEIHGMGACPQVATFHEEAFPCGVAKFAACFFKLGEGADGAANEVRGFVAVGCDKRGKGEEFFAHGIHGTGFHEGGSAGGDHHGVEHEGNTWSRGAQFAGNGANDGCGEKHPCLHGRDGQGFKDEANLVCDNARAEGRDAVDAAGMLRDDRGDGGGPVDAQGGECLEVGLDSRATAVVRARDG